MANKRPRPTTANATISDDFKLINSISGKMESRLQRAGIKTYAQLAELMPSEIARQLGNPAGLLERIIRENWAGQARELAELGERKKNEAADSDKSLSDQRYETFAAELSLDSQGQVLSTRLMHVPSGEEACWEGWHEQLLLDFFAQRAGLRLSAKNETKTSSAGKPETITPDLPNFDAAGESVAEIEKKRLQKFVVMAGGERASRLLQHNQPFRVRLWLDETALAKRPFAYSAVIQARNLADENQTSHHQEGYVEFGETALLDVENVLLNPGAYRLRAVVTLHPRGAQVSPDANYNFQVEGGVLQVC
jgi:hypothetical protein